jgi:Fe-S-cluster containining protein
MVTSSQPDDRVHREEFNRGLIYTHNRANANTAELHRVVAMLTALSDLLVERGLLDREEIEARKQAAAQALQREYLSQGMGTAMQDFGVSKYQFHLSAEVDCASKIHLCRAACCRLPLALSREDVREGVMQWDPGQPYMIARGEDGFCVHMDRETRGCTVYEQRPIPCRGNDCRQDRRIWLDFDAGVVNPRINDEGWPASLEIEDVEEPGGEHQHG